MKHIVNLVLSQPYHEHVSLRSRTKSHNHIVEARTAEEAMNRASRQYTALGYKVHTATIVEQKIEKSEPKQNVVLETKEEPIEEALLPKQQAVADKLKDTELAANKEKAGFKYGKALRAAKVAAKKLKEESEIQYIEEKLTADDPASKWISDFVKSDNPKFAGKSKKERINQALGAYYAAKRGTNEEVEQVDEGSKRMSAAVKLQRAFDREKTASDASRERGEEVLAQARAEYAKKQAAKTNEEAEQVDEANMRFDYEAAARPKSSDVKNFLNRDKNARAAAASKKYIRRMTKLGGLGPNQTKKDTEAHMKAHFEEVDEATDPGKLRVVNKKVESQASKDTKKSEKKMKATEKAVQVAKGKKNPVNLKPVLGGDKLQNA
jgi:hypothetical protein